MFTGITFVLICLLHGATFLGLKTTGEMHQRSRQTARRIAPFTGVAVIGFIIWTHVTASSAFFLNLIELTAILAVIAAVWLVFKHRDGFAFAATTVTVAVLHPGDLRRPVPDVMVSSTNPAYNLDRAQHRLGAYSLKAMTVVVIIFLPLVLGYQAWTYYVSAARQPRRIHRAGVCTRQEPATDAPLTAFRSRNRRKGAVVPDPEALLRSRNYVGLLLGRLFWCRFRGGVRVPGAGQLPGEGDLRPSAARPGFRDHTGVRWPLPVWRWAA